jgi:hypothetical protein
MTCHCRLFIQIVRLKKTMSKWTFFCCNASLVTVHMYYHCQQHKFLKHCCSACHIVHNDMQLNHTHTHTHSKCGVATATVDTPTYRNVRQYVYKQHCVRVKIVLVIQITALSPKPRTELWLELDITLCTMCRFVLAMYISSYQLSM